MPILLPFERHIAQLEEAVSRLEGMEPDDPAAASVEQLRREVDYHLRAFIDSLTAYQRTMICRHPERPYPLDYIDWMFTDWIELHGDRGFMDDPSIVAGFARLDGRPIVVIGQQKGRTAKEMKARNFGMPKPEGFRKALRMMRLAERLGRPIITFIDTPGAYPGIGAEQRGQAEAIARNIMEMSRLGVPVVTVVTGEGGSGGALGLSVANRIVMLEHSMFSVISPEACASILWRSRKEAPLAAEALRYDAESCRRIHVADELIDEPSTGAHRDPQRVARQLKEVLSRHLGELTSMNPDQLRADRYRKLRHLGFFHRGVEEAL